jgi:signal transduction histidine kinase
MDVWGRVLILGATLPLAVRRIWPLAALALATAATSTYLVLGYPYGPILLALGVAVYTVAVLLPARPATIAAAIALVVLLLHVVFDEPGSALWGIIPGSAWVVVPFAVGRLVRTGRETAARARTDLIQRQAYEERLRVAQEVHDVVGHGLAAIHMQAEIALHVLPRRPEQAEPALRAISRTSKQALDELRATLALVRRGSEPRTPGPGLSQLDDLATRMAGTGVTVTVTVSGLVRDIPSAADLAAYRIVQEALTNVLRHAGTSSAAVTVFYGPKELAVEVTDSGRGPTGSDGGHGIAGMRERVAALDGRFEAGPRPGGGFRVSARFPLPEEGTE